MGIRVALLVDSPSKRAHGNVASRLALGLAATEGVDVELVCHSDDPTPAWLPPSVSVHRLGTERISRALPAIVRYLETHRPDVLVTRQVHANLIALAASRSARLRGWHGRLVLVQDHPIALSHASNWKDNKWAAKLLYRFADGVISPSPTVRDDITAWCGLDPARVALVPNPMPIPVVDPAPPHPWLADDGAPVFVHTSNMTYWKRLDLLVEAFALLRTQHEARLLVVGEGPGRAGAEEHIARLGLGDVARTVGWVDDPLQYASHAWAFVLPSDEEGFAQVLTEAMSVGCPVVTTDAQGGGPRFVTRDGACGLLVPRDDPAALAAAMAEVLDPATRARLVALGAERVRELSPEHSAQALVGFVTEQLAVAG